ANNVEIIILSDDEEEASENDPACTESSVYIVEPETKREPDVDLNPRTLEEDLVVTFSRPAQVLPHARYDCPLHPFTAADDALDAPLAANQLICDQCFCYICDKLASQCQSWCQRGSCHCNGYKKSRYWSNLRSCVLLGVLHSFNLTPSEMDAPLRHAEQMLQIFKKNVCVEFGTFLKGKSPPNAPNQVHEAWAVAEASVHHASPRCSYTPVFGLVSTFLDEADKQDDRAAAVLRLGAAEEFIRHVNVPRGKHTQAVSSYLPVFSFARVISSLQRQLVTADFTPEFRQKLQAFYRRFLFPVELKNLKNSLTLPPSLCVRPWDDILLATVLKGQNVSGIRKDGKRRDVLTEEFSVILLRSELLQRQQRYRELCRYLRVVQAAESAPGLQLLCDLVPFFLCLEGDFLSAVDSLLRLGNAPASRFTPQLFLIYLCVFKSATAPKVTIGHPSHRWHSDEAWEPIPGAVPLKREALVKFVLKVHECCPAVYASSQCWASFLAVVHTPADLGAALRAPRPRFLFVSAASREARAVVNSILLDQHLQIPRFFLEEYPDQALLLLVTGALGLRILRFPLKPALPVLGTFRDNVWALEWL
uniref:Zgc:112980 n=1 Tax=Tetraodon nigroviridis TaxID=99883 RepID=H3CS68_TETNG